MLLSKSGVTVDVLVNVAVLSVPPATMPPDHRAVLDQDVGDVRELFHVPLWATALPGHACTAMTATTAAETVSHRGRSPLDSALTPVVILAMSVTSKKSYERRSKKTRQSLFRQNWYVIPRLMAANR